MSRIVRFAAQPVPSEFENFNRKHIMHIIKITLALAFTGMAASAFAGPDWTVIERAREAAHRAHATAAQPQEAMTDHCAQMMQRTSTSSAQWMGNAVGSHGTTNSGADASVNRVWGNLLTSVSEVRSPFLDGGRSGTPDVFTDGALSLAGMDRTGVSAPPAHARDPYTDGARAGSDSSLQV